MYNEVGCKSGIQALNKYIRMFKDVMSQQEQQEHWDFLAEARAEADAEMRHEHEREILNQKIEGLRKAWRV